jgi:UPF0716 protein FxsA
MASLLLLFIVVPALELALLIEVGSRIGTPATLAIIVGTGIVGAALAKQQGLRTVRKIQSELESGGLPADAMIDGVLILIAGALLITPGILTDLAGFLCLFPATRALAKRSLQRRFERAVAEQRVHIQHDRFEFRPPGADPHAAPERPPIVDVTPEGPPGREPRRPLH